MGIKLICKNDRCYQVVPGAANQGRPKEFCEEKCRKRYNARLSYQRATKGSSFTGLRMVIGSGYPKVTRKVSATAADAEKRVKEHGENCTGPGIMCQAKLKDAYNRNKFCLVRAVFTDDWLVLMYGEDGMPHEREMTTEEGMWKDDFNTMMEETGLTGEEAVHREEKKLEEELNAFQAAGGGRA